MDLLTYFSRELFCFRKRTNLPALRRQRFAACKYIDQITVFGSLYAFLTLNLEVVKVCGVVIRIAFQQESQYHS